MTFDTPQEGRGFVLLTYIHRKQLKMYTMTPIIRPEHYVLPVRHPPNCRCTQHGVKKSSQSAATFNPNCLFDATLSNAGPGKSNR